MSKPCNLRLASIALLGVIITGVEGAHLRGRIVHVGFPASSRDIYTRGADHYRPGCWTPISVELTNDDSDLCEVVIEVRQADRDGDQVVATRKVMVRGTRGYYLYVPGGSFRDRNQFAVRIYDADGKLAPLYDDRGEPIDRITPPRELQPVSSEAQILLDISARPVNQLARLAVDPRLNRELIVARSSPKDLPENVTGLDMVDIVVWDAADPSTMDLPQQEALIEWVKHGGRLVIAVSKNWELLVKSRFGDLLPARLAGTDRTHDVQAELGEDLFGGAAPILDTPLTYCPITPASLFGDATAIMPAYPEPGLRIFVSSRPCGRGELVLVAAELHDLLLHGTLNQPFLRKVMGIRRIRTGSESAFGTDLFKYVEQLIGFEVTTSLYFLIAFAFAIAYIAISTAGSWFWLKRKGFLGYSWPVFALVAVLGSATSLLGVQLIRGIGLSVQEVTVIDGRAGSFDALATCYFGLKSATHTQIDLAIAAEDADNSVQIQSTLCPLPADQLSHDFNVYAAAQRYEAVAELGQLRSVSLRATLKQFEGQWQGRMPGRIQAALHRQEKSSYLRGDSWLENDLKTDLDHCYLLVPAAALSRDRRNSSRIHVYPIGKLSQGQRLTLSELLAAKNKAVEKSGRSVLDDLLDKPKKSVNFKPPLLSEFHNRWLKSVHRSYPFGHQQDDPSADRDNADFANALLLMSTYEDVDRSEFQQQGRTIERSRGQRLDRSTYLTERTALFIGFGEEPSPARLCYRRPGAATGKWKPIQPSKATVMYRIAVPIAGP